MNIPSAAHKHNFRKSHEPLVIPLIVSRNRVHRFGVWSQTGRRFSAHNGYIPGVRLRKTVHLCNSSGSSGSSGSSSSSSDGSNDTTSSDTLPTSISLPMKPPQQKIEQQSKLQDRNENLITDEEKNVIDTKTEKCLADDAVKNTHEASLPNPSHPEKSTSEENSLESAENFDKNLSPSLRTLMSNLWTKITTEWRSQQLPRAPWGMGTIAVVMILWLVCFYVAAYDIVPFMLRMLGITVSSTAPSRYSLPTVQAIRHLLLDTTQLTMTLFILHRALSSYKPRSLGFFSIQFRPIARWLPIVLAGMAAFPLVDLLHKAMVSLLASSPVTTGSPSPSVSNAAFVAGASWEVRGMWFLVLAVCAPVWEEVMFRGFLLPSLARYLSPPLAVAASSLVFATVHFTKEGFLPLLVLGGVFGVAYLSTMNLLPAVALHSLWNICLLTQILMSG